MHVGEDGVSPEFMLRPSLSASSSADDTLYAVIPACRRSLCSGLR